MKILSAILAVIMMASINLSNVFAVETENENDPLPNTYTIQIDVPAGSEYDISPCIWGEFCPGLMNGVTYKTSSFLVPDRYFAYEVYATAMDGSAASGSYGVNLMVNEGLKAFLSGNPNGTKYKNDWIDTIPGTYYYFSIHNGSDKNLSVYITYYSWA